MKNIIESQIEFLKQHQHIKKVQRISNRLIHLVYFPKAIKSPLANYQYRLKIELSSKYPQQPPVLRFMDPIDHINVCHRTGEVVMPILKEDWSPYISPYILIDIIDTLLVEPELSPEFMVGRQKPAKNGKSVNSMKSLSSINSQLEHRKSSEDQQLRRTQKGSQGFQKIKTFQSVILNQSNSPKKEQVQTEEELNKPITSMKKRLKKLKTIVLEKAEFESNNSQVFTLKSPRSPASPVSPQQPNIFGIQSINGFHQEPGSPRTPKTPIFSLSGIKTQRKGTMKSQALSNISQVQEQTLSFGIEQDRFKKQMITSFGKKNSQKNTKQMLQSKKIFPIEEENIHNLYQSKQHTTKKEGKQNNSNAFINMPTLKRDTSDQLLEQLRQTIHLQSKVQTVAKINKLINFITKECSQLQNRKESTKNEQIIKMLNNNINDHIEMLQDLQSMSLKLKKNMIKRLKDEIS